ncbi:MAG: D-tyrosyl-tRNA(Tyr) deacylase [Gemmatimonadetes bacterium]|nr:D-tyrosyl-tRNA(Tyr) deacylase [Gemmatimonadota bacterium]NIO32639.1 D-tyrosyl-tRNA(Tyr) deacylase [Gemmatimonadota bacterium]
MRVVLQRVARAAVRVDGETLGGIGRGFLLLVGFRHGDSDEQLRWMADKIRGLRLFPDGEGKMNLPIDEIGGELLVVSQFTLYGDVRKGRRPSFVDAAEPDEAERLYDRFVDILRQGTIPVATGSFGALMEVDLINDGPVTLIIERD